jgi:predicted nucleic acid-binding protein
VSVLDASLIVEVILRTPLGIRHADRILDVSDSLHVPHLLDVETVQVLRRLTLAGELAPERAEEALDVLADLPLVRHDHTILITRAWALCTSMTAYDAMYVALAEGLDAVLLTCDGRLARSHGHRARIELLN